MIQLLAVPLVVLGTLLLFAVTTWLERHVLAPPVVTPAIVPSGSDQPGDRLAER